MVGTLAWVGVPARSAPAEVREAIEHAWVHDRVLRITYHGARGVSDRTVRLKEVVLERTMTLLNCHDLDIDESRQFRMHRIQHAEVVEGTRYDRPPTIS